MLEQVLHEKRTIGRRAQSPTVASNELNLLDTILLTDPAPDRSLPSGVEAIAECQRT